MKNNRLGLHKQMLEYGIMKPYPNIFCFSTTRYGGCGEGAYASFNCTHYCGDNPDHVAKNREILCSLMPVQPAKLIIPRQTHTTNVRVVTDGTTGEELMEVDAVVTDLKGYCLCVSTADCVPVLLYDKEKQVVAAVHAGWRGTVGRIVEKTLAVMKTQYDTTGKDVVACIGPSISLEAFEVGDEVYEAFAEAGFDMSRIAQKYAKWHLDLWEANRLHLLAEGVKEENIKVAGICTYNHCDDFFSARRLGIKSGRILSGIMLYD